ncbi:MAG: hypothetical protein KAH98_00675 [Dehalococcoidia bacterium]|nr:hypothetical protein [Dehalococcoidia bacterium]
MAEICDVCGEPLDENNVSRCRICGGRFYMAWSIDAPVEKCGQAWFEERSCSLGFICAPCINENPQIRRSLIDTGGTLP